MKIVTRSLATVAAAALTAGMVTVAPSEPTLDRAAPASTVQLTAAVRPLLLPAPPGADAAPGSPAVLAIPIAPNLANTIDATYNAIEPWVQYGFEVAAAAVAWIPYVGWFSGQIMVLYDFGESIVASGVYNFTDFLRGDGGIISNLVDFGIDVGLAFVWLGLDEVAQFFPLPPFCCYPPRPPVADVDLGVLAAPVEEPVAMMAAQGEEDVVEEQVVSDEVIVDEADPVDNTEGTQDEVVVAEDEKASAQEDVVEEEVVTEEDDDVTEPTTDTAGTVEAQGEVRTGLDATPADNTTAEQDADPSLNRDPVDPDPSAPADATDNDADDASEATT